MPVLKTRPPYKPLVQIDYCCAPCAFLWILHRRGYWVDQEEIAQYCRLKIPKRLQKLFTRKMLIAKSRKDEGTSVEKFHFYFNRLLRKKKIPLKIDRFYISKIKNPKEFLVENMKKKFDMILDFACKPFPEYEFDQGGHTCVVAELDTEKEIVTLGDPSWIHAKFWKAPLSKLVKAMDKKFDGHERGFWVVKPKKA